jgi:hypothetical protein
VPAGEVHDWTVAIKKQSPSTKRASCPGCLLCKGSGSRDMHATQDKAHAQTPSRRTLRLWIP